MSEVFNRLLAKLGIKSETMTRKEVLEFMLWHHIGSLSTAVADPELYDDELSWVRFEETARSADRTQ